MSKIRIISSNHAVKVMRWLLKYWLRSTVDIIAAFFSSSGPWGCHQQKWFCDSLMVLWLLQYYNTEDRHLMHESWFMHTHTHMALRWIVQPVIFSSNWIAIAQYNSSIRLKFRCAYVMWHLDDALLIWHLDVNDELLWLVKGNAKLLFEVSWEIRHLWCSQEEPLMMTI